LFNLLYASLFCFSPECQNALNVSGQVNLKLTYYKRLASLIVMIN